MSTPAERLAALRSRMAELGLDALWVRATDRFLNEYVPAAESTRVWLSGFAGSTGDGLVLREGLLPEGPAARMFVDGRYDLQARRELDGACWGVELLPLGLPIERGLAQFLAALPGREALTVGLEADRFALATLDRVREWLPARARVELLATSPIESVRGPVEPSRGALRAPEESRLGGPVSEKHKELAAWLARHELDAMVVQRLDELAYLTNLRGDELPYQATFRATALVTRAEVLVALDPALLTPALRAARPTLRFTDDAGLDAAVRACAAEGAPQVAGDPSGTTVAMRVRLEGLGARVLPLESPLTARKARKTQGELDAMRDAFRRADRVVHEVQRWLTEQVLAGARVSEVDFAKHVEKSFRAAGAAGLSFKVISACGENAALPHHVPSPERFIQRGEMMLLDTGAYFDEGYATDLTRTFFVGGPGDEPTAEMRRYFTCTLKSAIAGMTARIPRGANGAQLDGLCRAPLWSAGFEYNHGTGHGVGVNVHEFPPRVASVALSTFEPGQVFSIEPGVYLSGKAGVRIENLCTVVPDPEDDRFLRVRTMTFSPLDARLVDDAMLTTAEKEFLAWFQRQYEA